MDPATKTPPEKPAETAKKTANQTISKCLKPGDKPPTLKDTNPNPSNTDLPKVVKPVKETPHVKSFNMENDVGATSVESLPMVPAVGPLAGMSALQVLQLHNMQYKGAQHNINKCVPKIWIIKSCDLTREE